MKEKNYLTTAQAAEKLGVNDSRIRQMILAGELPAAKFGHVWMVAEDDLKKMDETRRLNKQKPK